MKFSMNKVATATMVTVAVLAMSAGSALAVPVFTINSAAIGTPDVSMVVGDKFAGSSSELLTTAAGGHTGSGWLQINSLDLLSSSQKAFGAPGNTYGLFVSFYLADTYGGGGTGIDTANSVNNVKTLDFRVFADPLHKNVFTQAGVGPLTNASYTDPGADDILLGFGTLITGVSGFNSLGGAHFNSIEQFSLCTAANTSVSGTTDTSAVKDHALATFAAGCTSGKGKAFFVNPDPFFTLAFTEFNNTTQGISRDAAGHTAITQATGAVDFNKVPEPGSVALVGIALAGLGVSLRRNKAAS